MKRIAAILLSLLVIVAYVPLMSYGAASVTKVSTKAELQKAIDNSTTSVHIQLAKNISTGSGSISVPEGKKVYLDLNGFYLRGSSADYYAMMVDGYLQISDSEGGGYIREVSGYGSSNIVLKSGTIKGGTITEYDRDTYGNIKTDKSGNKIVKSTYGQGALMIYGGFSMSGGTVTADMASAISIYSEKTMTISGGTVSSGSSSEAAIYINAGTLNVTGGTITGTYRGIWGSGSEARVNISGGEISGVNSYAVYQDYGAKRELTGGIYSSKPVAGIPEDYRVEKRNDGRYEIVGGHDWSTEITVRSEKGKDGKLTKTCTECGAKKTVKVYAIDKMLIAYKNCSYTGEANRPAVTVYNVNGGKIASRYYDVKYTKNVDVGTATVTATFKDKYKGKLTRTYNIRPKATSIREITPLKKGFKVKWYRRSIQNDGYQVRYSTASTFKSYTTKKLKKFETTSKEVTDLKAKKKYYVKVRTYRTVGDKIYYGNWSKVKTVTTK